MLDLKRFQSLQERVEELQREASKAQGALEQLKKDLKKEFGCKTIKAAKVVLKKLEWEEQQKEQEFALLLAEFEEQFGEVLKGD
jgi:type II secretory pathway component PulJ